MHFKIGEQYEEQEFNLQWIYTISFSGLDYEVYRYNSIPPNKTDFKDIRLYYNADILSAVHYQLEKTFNSNVIQSIKDEIENEVIIYDDSHNLWITNSVFDIEMIR